MVKSFEEFTNREYSLDIFTKKQLFQLCSECKIWNIKTLRSNFKLRKDCIIYNIECDNLVNKIKDFIKSRPIGINADCSLYINNETYEEIRNREYKEASEHIEGENLIMENMKKYIVDNIYKEYKEEYKEASEDIREVSLEEFLNYRNANIINIHSITDINGNIINIHTIT